MSRIPPSTPAPHPAEPVTAVCAATYYADLRDEYAFTFRVPVTNTRFTIYAPSGYTFEVGQEYALILAAPDAVPLPLAVEDIEFLRHCLTNTAQRWCEAIAEADTAAQRPQRDRTPEPGYLNAEPTPTGYRHIAGAFRDELARVEQLNVRLGEFLRTARTGTEGDRP